MRQIATELIQWIDNPENSDQNAVSKTEFVKIAKEGESSKLSGAGVSNPKLKKKASEFYKNNKIKSEDEFHELFNELEKVYMNGKYIEERILVFFILEKYKKMIQKEHKLVFNRINKLWIDEIDHWTTADHLCINVFKHIPIYQYNKTIDSWAKSDNFWRQRLSIVAYIKHIKSEEKVHRHIIQNIDLLKETKNYYVRKSFPWILREISKVNSQIISEYLDKNVQYLTKTELKEASKNLSENIKKSLLEKYENYKTGK